MSLNFLIFVNILVAAVQVWYFISVVRWVVHLHLQSFLLPLLLIGSSKRTIPNQQWRVQCNEV